MDREDAKKQGVKDVDIFDDDDDDDDDEEIVTDYGCIASEGLFHHEDEDEEGDAYRYDKYEDDRLADEEEDEEFDEEEDDEFIDEEEYDEEYEQGEIDPSSPVPMVRSIKTTETLPLTPFMQRLGFGTGVQVMRVKRTLNSGADRSPWAIKMLCPRKESSATINERLVQEAEILRELNHPNIVGFRGHGEISADHTYLAMEYCSLTLGNVLEERFNEELGPLEVPNASKVVVNVLSALVYLHTKALLIHGDIKSYNVLIKNDYEMVKLCDFGVSIKVTPDGKIDRAANPDAHYIGTSLWLPPEMLPHSGQEHHEVSTKSDMFAFGLLVYEMLVCTPPHTYPGLQDGYVSYPSEVIMMRQTSSKPVQEAASKPRKLEMSVTLTDDDDDDDDVQIVQDTDEECAPSTKSLKRGITETSGGDVEVVISPKKAKSVPTDGEQPVEEQTSEQEGEVANVREKNADQEKEGEPDSEAGIASAQEGKRIDAFDKEANQVEKQDKEEATETNVEEKATERKIEEEATERKVEEEATERKVEEDATGRKVEEDATGRKVEEEATERKIDSEDATVKKADEYSVKIADEVEATEKPADVEASEKTEAKEKASEQVEATVPPENKTPIEALPVSSETEIGQSASNAEDTPAPPNDDEKKEAGGNAAPQEADIIYTISDSEDDEPSSPKGIILEVSDDDESDYDGEREVGEITYEEGVEYESTFLNYNHMGTRPPIPSEVTLGPDYGGLLTVFHACTEPSPLDRPSAATLLEAFRQELNSGAVDSTDDGGKNPKEPAAAAIAVDTEANAEIVQLLRNELAKE
uniref:Protein kinase domain-containing protein n=1 Tax=Anopheles farauti TaxID=69004 RepID=A0A182QID9_9DIPT